MTQALQAAKARTMALQQACTVQYVVPAGAVPGQQMSNGTVTVTIPIGAVEGQTIVADVNPTAEIVAARAEALQMQVAIAITIT